MLLIVLTTVAARADADELAERLVDSGVAGCVQILPQMTSVYRWRGTLQKDSEYLLIIKTLPERYDEVEALLTSLHPYEVPEIVAVDATRASQAYLNFLNDAVGGD